MRTILRHAAFAAIAVAPLACFHDDDDDDGAPPPAAVDPKTWVAGSWFLAGFEHDYQSDVHVCLTGTVEFDGAGVFNGAVTANRDGTIEAQTVTGTYDVAPDGQFTLTDSDGAVVGGAVDPSRDAIIGARVEAGLRPFIVCFVRQSGAYTGDSLAGPYHVAGFQWESGEVGAYASYTGAGAFGPGVGTFMFDAVRNWAGVVEPLHVEMPYAVSPDGTVALGDFSRRRASMAATRC